MTFLKDWLEKGITLGWTWQFIGLTPNKKLPNPEREVCVHNRPINWPCKKCEELTKKALKKNPQDLSGMMG